MKNLDINQLSEKLDDTKLTSNYGHITRVIGLIIESKGPEVSIGELCLIKSKGKTMKAEVVGFDDNRVLLMPIGEMEGINPGARVIATGEKLKVKVGEEMLGQVLNGVGEPLLDNGETLTGLTERPVDAQPPNPLKRKRITEPLSLGIKSIDGLLTCGRGQRVGIFAGRGVGQST